ncbi:MAG: TetR/AcrR family transcriptional regulator [Hyphomonadaceae bacterium]
MAQMIKRARSEEAKDTRRNALLAAALDEFVERGFAAAKIDDIARRAGLSKGALYLYFDSKEALFKGLIETVAMPRVEEIEAAIAGAPSIRQALEVMSAIAPTIIRESPLPRFMKVLIGDAKTFPDILQSYRREVLERVLGAISAALERAMDRGEIARHDPDLLARIVVSPIPLSGIWHILFGADPDAAVNLEELFRLHADLLGRALAVDGAEK